MHGSNTPVHFFVLKGTEVAKEVNDMQHKVIFEWQNYVTQNCEYVLMTDSQEENFFLMKLSSRGNEIDQYECTDRISICEIIADRIDEYSVINYLEDDYYHVFKKFFAEESKNSSDYAWDVFESALDNYAEENSIAGTPQQEMDYQTIIHNWCIWKNAEVGSTDMYFNVYTGGVHAVVEVIREMDGGNQSFTFSGRSWKDVFRKGFADEVSLYLKSAEPDRVIFNKRQLDLLKKEGGCY